MKKYQKKKGLKQVMKKPSDLRKQAGKTYSDVIKAAGKKKGIA